MKIEKIHHVAYRCMDAKTTVEFYQKYLNMDFVLAISEDKVPSTGEPDPYIHLFMDAGNGNVLAFFEIPNSPKMGWDPNTPDWVQHIAFKVADEQALLETKKKLEKDGIKVIGPTNHHIWLRSHCVFCNFPRLQFLHRAQEILAGKSIQFRYVLTLNANGCLSVKLVQCFIY